jgi:hypothetical protein
MGLFGLGKEKKAKKEPKKEKKEDIELGPDGIKFVAIIEMLGTPKKYVYDTLSTFADRIKQNKDYHVFSSKISKPKEVEKDEKDPEVKKIKKTLFSSFVEITIGVKTKTKLFDFCFNYMPSSVEIVEPLNINFSANELSSYLSDIQGTLHEVDFSLKQTNAANQILTQRLQTITKNMLQMLQNNIFLSLKEKNKELGELVKNVGIVEEQLKPFLDKMVAAGVIKLEKNKYSILKK